jgi:hypothetical protein
MGERERERERAWNAFEPFQKKKKKKKKKKKVTGKISKK